MKRSHNILTLKEKCKVLDLLDTGKSIRTVAARFNVPKSTVYDIRRKKNEIRHIVSTSFQGPGK